MSTDDSIDLTGYEFKPFPKNRDHFNDVSGRKFHRLEVIGYLGGGKWLCRCDCGSLKRALSVALLIGDYKSCGCAQYSNRKKLSEEERRERLKASNRASRERNKDKIRERNREYFQKNKARDYERNREWRKRNPERVKAIHDRVVAKRGHIYRQRQNERYKSEKDIFLERCSKRYREKQAYLDRLKTERGCQSCGERDVLCLEFHHPDRTQKVAPVTELTRRSWKLLLEEIEKTVILCANCHIKADAEINGRSRECRSRYKSYRQKKNYIDSIKAKTGCIRCGEKDILCLVFHHRNPRKKTNNMATLCATRSLAVVKREVKLCDVLCCNCHRKAHGITRRSSRLLKKVQVKQLLLFESA